MAIPSITRSRRGASTTPANRPSMRKRRLLKSVGPIAAVLPAIIMVFLFLAYPIGYGVWISFQDVSLFTLGAGEFIGLANYIQLFQQPEFLNALWRTMLFVFGVIVLGMVQSLLFALTLHHLPDWARPVRALSLIPFFISSVAVAMVWRFFVQSEGGFTSFFSDAFGQEPLSWLGNPTLALVVIIVASVWTFAPFSVLLLLSGLQTVNDEMYDAADVDGAGPLQKFLYITIPALRPQFATSLIWLTFQAFNSFGLILALTGGGPGGATELLAVFMYGLGLQSLDISASSAVMVLILLFNAIFSFVYLKLLPQDEPSK